MREYHVLNLGAGVQSTALYLLAREPDSGIHIDVAVFADTQEEPTAVYEHLAWLQSLGDPPILIRTAGKLGDDLLAGKNTTGQRFASIPAFVADDHRTRPAHCGAAIKYGMVRRQCTSEYKIAVCERAIRRDVLGLQPRRHVPRDVVVYQYYGITTDEAQRAERAKRRFDKVRWSRPVYPFLFRNWSRQDCIDYLKSRVPHAVPKSACVFCPFRNNESWRWLRDNDPDGWARAVQIDHALRQEGTRASLGMNRSLYLHRKCVPLDVIDFGTPQQVDVPGGMANECEGMCGV